MAFQPVSGQLAAISFQRDDRQAKWLSWRRIDFHPPCGGRPPRRQMIDYQKRKSLPHYSMFHQRRVDQGKPGWSIHPPTPLLFPKSVATS
jgi:hypothetical protein